VIPSLARTGGRQSTVQSHEDFCRKLHISRGASTRSIFSVNQSIFPHPLSSPVPARWITSSRRSRLATRQADDFPTSNERKLCSRWVENQLLGKFAIARCCVVTSFRKRSHAGLRLEPFRVAGQNLEACQRSGPRTNAGSGALRDARGCETLNKSFGRWRPSQVNQRRKPQGHCAPLLIVVGVAWGKQPFRMQIIRWSGVMIEMSEVEFITRIPTRKRPLKVD